MFLVPHLLSCLVVATLCQQQEVPYVSYVSRPDIFAPALNVRVFDENATSPGYIFLSTWSDDSDGIVQNGPYIYSNEGDLVYSGHQPSNPSSRYFNFQSHELSNKSRILSVFKGTSNRGRGKGQVALYDYSYQLIRTISSPDCSTWAYDFHEFLLLDDGRTAVMVSMQPLQADLSIFGINDGLGWLLDAVFHVVDLEKDDNVVFEWRASEHILLNESILPPSAKRYAGMSYGAAYDYFHINSIDRFANGDWLLSARHTNTLYRISGQDGSILWRLGGLSSSFEMIDFVFSAQHHARILSESSEHLFISLFDNAYNGKTRTSNVSSAIVVELDLSLHTAQLRQQVFPLHVGLAQNQGSMQTLPDGNTLVSWGLTAEFSEFDKHGNRVLDVALPAISTRAYRVSKSGWCGSPPVDAMTLYLYARNTSSSTHFWMSWNGATQVEEWIIYADSSELLGKVEHMGFETHFDGRKFVTRGYVEAVGKDGKTLGRSKDIGVFVPPASLADACGEEHCTMQVLLSNGPAKPRKVKPDQRAVVRYPGRDMAWYSMAAAFITGAGMARVRWSNVFGRIAATLPR